MRNQPNILIVDDLEENLLLLQTVMRKLGANLITALNGAEALEKSYGKELALAILDVRMPEMSGYELATLLNEDRKHARVPIIFITANPVNDDQLFKAYGSGAVDYLLKPMKYNILLCKINVFIDLFNQKRTIIKDAALLRRSAALIDDTRIILKKTESTFQEKVSKALDGAIAENLSDIKKNESKLTKLKGKLKKHKEDLNKAIVHAEVSSDNYAKAYDFAPSGYFTLSSEKEIQELNQSGARMLDRSRNRLINSDFGQFIAPESKPVFNAFCARLFDTGLKEECEIKLMSGAR